MHEMHIEHARRLLAEVFGNGQSLAIVGWIEHNHNAFTKSLPTNKVLFFDKSPNAMPKHVGIVITTRFISHTGLSKLRNKSNSYKTIKGIFSIGEIRKLLMESNLFPKKSIDSHHSHQQSQVTMQKEEVSARTPCKNIQTTGHASTDQLIDFATGANGEPTDPFQKATWLIKREPELQKEMVAIQDRAENLQEELEAILIRLNDIGLELSRTSVVREAIEKLKNA